MPRYEDDEDDSRKRKRRQNDEHENSLPKSPPSLRKVASIIRMVVYSGLLLCILFGGLLFRMNLQDSRSHPETAAIAAVYATNFIALYIVARCIEKFLNSAERARGEDNLGSKS
jgi:hypothetical protein